ncbi:BRCT domain-containing protein [Bowmanella dokdonensis]|uniref:BRCT domain-containing protein n=1 Tax=Bowmanella dokdonensis TaxID=751969 RepID=A0A939DRA1_9ALTE|nr:BRCT domain-containing protein [Bowmanella dokdonensis]MBN7827362.1 BRCT domain-containing protein [Bowmanella dokdonensis]
MEFNVPAFRPHQFANRKRNIDKAVNGLIGILSGVTADTKLNQNELMYLNIWLKSQSSLRDDPDAIDLLDLIADVVEDGAVSSEEMHDLLTLCNDVVTYRSSEDEGIYEAKINEFLGVLQGVVADGSVNRQEFDFLIGWLRENDVVEDDWLVEQVVSRANQIMSDGIVTQGELTEFGDLVKQLTGYQFNETGSAECSSIAYLEDSIEKIEQDSLICFTGTFVSGSRRILEGLAVSKGLKPKNRITKSLNYLVIGELVTPDWRFQSYGRKIEQAVKYREEGIPIKILSEKNWTQLID